jgi:hypothetical protein
MDTTAQIVLIIMIVVLGSTLTAVGIMFIFILKDLRLLIGNLNNAAEDFQTMTDRVASGTIKVEETLTSLKGMIDSFREQTASPVGSIFGIINFVRSLMNKKGGDK